jgi:hypothetical protein
LLASAFSRVSAIRLKSVLPSRRVRFGMKRAYTWIYRAALALIALALQFGPSLIP